MTTDKYWRKAAEQREQEAHTEAEKYLKQMLQLYDDALEDIQKETSTIKGNYMKRFGIDEQTADFYLSREFRKYPSDELLQRLLTSGSEEERRAILDYIHSDGLSTRAYAARTEWFNGVAANIRLRMLELEFGLRTLGNIARRNTYINNYYRVIDDTAHGADMGISFSLIDEAALREVMDKPWHGKRFSERIWDNTQRLADEAQEIVGRYLVSGRSLDNAARELARSFEVEKFHATTLVHTETAHARAVSDRQAYEDIGAEEYRYMATLDEVTCDVCGPLDGQYFKMSEWSEGVNAPVMHPRCRCTTTIAMRFGSRRARDPISGKNKIIPDMSYDEWRQNMTDTEKQAFEVAGRKYRNKAADKAQYRKYKSVLGRENVPKTFDKWQDLKYTDSERWKEVKQKYFEIITIDKKIENAIVGLQTSNGITISGISAHAKDRITERKVTIEEIKNSLENPLYIGDVKIDSQNRSSQRFIGKLATSNINPDTGVIATVWKTGKDTIKKYERGVEQ